MDSRHRVVTRVGEGLFQICPPLKSAPVGQHGFHVIFTSRRLGQLRVGAKCWSLQSLASVNSRVATRLDVDEINKWLRQQKVSTDAVTVGPRRVHVLRFLIMQYGVRYSGISAVT